MPKTIFSEIISLKNNYQDKIRELPPFESAIFWPFLKLKFFGLKMIVFYPKYRTTIFSNIISVITAIKDSSIFGQNLCINTFGNVPFLVITKTSIFSS